MAPLDADKLWDEIVPDDNGLVPCVVHDVRSRAVLMVAWVSQAALAKSIETGWATYYSRSRRTLWEKGATSGNRQRLLDIRLDCDADTLLYVVEAMGPACHEGTDTCFSRRRVANGWTREPVDLQAQTSDPASILEDLEVVIGARTRGETAGKDSYTRRLVNGGIPAQVAKVREESEELAVALESEAKDRVVSEAADLLYHLAVALRERRLSYRDVFSELQGRFGTSGIEEKASRPKKTEG